MVLCSQCQSEAIQKEILNTDTKGKHLVWAEDYTQTELRIQPRQEGVIWLPELPFSSPSDQLIKQANSADMPHLYLCSWKSVQ